jgi:hypothetical protein
MLLGTSLLRKTRSVLLMVLEITVVVVFVSGSLAEAPANAYIRTHSVDQGAVVTVQNEHVYENVTVHNGALTLGGNDTLLVENCQFNLTGRLIIKDNAKVIIRNALFILTLNVSKSADNVSGFARWGTEHVIVRDRATFDIVNSEVMLALTELGAATQNYCTVLCYDQSTLNVTESELMLATGYGVFIDCFNSSRIYLRDTVLSSLQFAFWGGAEIKSGFGLADESKAEVQNSTLDTVVLGSNNGNCTAKFSRLKLTLEMDTYDGVLSVEITDSNMSTLEIYGNDAKVRLMNTTLTTIYGYHGNGNVVWLVNSTVQNVWFRHDSIWVVWNLPLFGQVSIPYDWVPLIIPVVVTVIVLIVFVVLAVALIIRRRRKRARMSVPTFKEV